jgi:hypothetical protein
VTAVTSQGLAATAARLLSKRKGLTVSDVRHLNPLGEVGWSFFVYDDQGGMLEVRVTQYKDPVR